MVEKQKDIFMSSDVGYKNKKAEKYIKTLTLRFNQRCKKLQEFLENSISNASDYNTYTFLDNCKYFVECGRKIESTNPTYYLHDISKIEKELLNKSLL